MAVVDEMVFKQPCALKVAFEKTLSRYTMIKPIPSTRMTTAAILREQLYKAKEHMDDWEEFRKTRMRRINRNLI